MMRGREYPWKRRPGWWLRNRRYLAFQLREVGGVICAVYALILLDLLVQLRAGASAYTAFLNLWRTPPMLYLNLVLFAFVLWHAISWFMLIGKAQPIQFTRRPLPWKVVFGVNVLLWLGVSGAVVYLIFGGI
jgi:fumarate reductase subunit C